VPPIENSEVVRHLLETLINISSRKTTKGHAILKINESIKQLQDKYDFLRHVEIKDTRFSEFEDTVSVMTDVNSVRSDDVGKAIYDIIKTTNKVLGKDAGHFFVKELRTNLGDEFNLVIEDMMGLDLGVMQLEHEVNELEKKLAEEE
jgi:hypothetical protein